MIFFCFEVIILLYIDIIMAVKNYKTKVTSKQEIAHSTYSVILETATKDIFEFETGQFATLLVAPQTRRSYSIASLPGKSYLELIADTVVGGPGSQFFENIKENDEVEFLFPLGNFKYKEDSKPAYFFATGTGVVPFMGMIKQALEVNNTKRKIYLYVGFRKEESIFAQSIFKELAEKYDNFDYCLTLSQPSDNWEGKAGRITKYYEKEIVDTNMDAYICGSHSMIEDVKDRLLAKGVQKETIFFEQFY